MLLCCERVDTRRTIRPKATRNGLCWRFRRSSAPPTRRFVIRTPPSPSPASSRIVGNNVYDTLFSYVLEIANGHYSLSSLLFFYVELPSEHLITIFFVSYMYIPCSFTGSWIMDQRGLRFGLLLGGFLQAVGAGLRYLACSFDAVEEVYLMMFVQTLASLAMTFMVNSPAMLSANWFPPSMRATSTSLALNANNLGTAIVYLTAPFILFSSDEVPDYNLYVAVFAVVFWIVALFVFRSSPKPLDGYSTVPNSAAHDEYDRGQGKNAFTHSGFWQMLVAFSLAECVFNAISALLGKFLSATWFSNVHVGLVGAAFIISSLIGSQVISHYVDRRRNHKTAMQMCQLLTAIATALFKLVPKVEVHATLACLLFLGVVLGPMQPIVLELGVECAYPTSEATVAALQQLCGNFFSALVVPGLSALQRTNFAVTDGLPPRHFYASPEWIMVFMTAVTFFLFCSLSVMAENHFFIASRILTCYVCVLAILRRQTQAFPLRDDDRAAS